MKTTLVFLGIWASFNALPFDAASFQANFIYPFGDLPSLKSAFIAWDSRWYLFIAEQGYRMIQSTAFPPLYPFFIRLLSPVLGSIGAGFLISNLCFFGAIVLLFECVRQKWDVKTAWLTVLLIFAFPTSFFFSLIYTESLFLLLLMVFFYGLQCNRKSWILISSFLLPLCRIVGLGILAPLAVYCIRERRPSSALLLLSPVLGLFVTLVITGSFFQDWLILFSAQDFWMSRFSLENVLQLFQWLQSQFLLAKLVFHGPGNSFVDRVVFLFLLGTIFAIYRHQPLEYFLFALCLGIVPAFLGNLMSYSRYIIVVFPFFIQFALWCREQKGLRAYLFFLFLFVQVNFIMRYAINYWAS